MQPYEDDPQNYGLIVTDLEWLLNATLASDRSGLQVFYILKIASPLSPIDWKSCQ